MSDSSPTTDIKPDNYFIQSLLVVICCCPPMGIVGMIYAAQVDRKWNAGDYDGSVAAARAARRWAIGGLVVNLIVNLAQVVWLIYAYQNGQLDFLLRTFPL